MGVFDCPEGTLFYLADKEANAASEWIGVGSSFDGCTLQSFDPRTETLRVSRGAQVLDLPLRSSKVRRAVPVQITFPREKIVDHMSKRYAGAKVVLRVSSRLTGGREIFVCTEVWKSDGGAPQVGSVLRGSILSAELQGDYVPYEAIMFFDSFPPGKDIPHSGYPQLVNGRFPWCPELDPNDLRAILTTERT